MESSCYFVDDLSSLSISDPFVLRTVNSILAQLFYSKKVMFRLVLQRPLEVVPERVFRLEPNHVAHEFVRIGKVCVVTIIYVRKMLFNKGDPDDFSWKLAVLT